MIIGQNIPFQKFSEGTNRYVFLPSGDIREFTGNDVMINQFMGEPLDGSINNIYLTFCDGTSYPLLGSRSASVFLTSDTKAVYRGKINEIAYQVIFTYAEGGLWFWRVELQGNGEKVRLVYGQDVGLGDKNGVRTNELYISQYVDHYIHETAEGFHICSRQNMNSGFPYLQQGCIDTQTVGYCTDGMQFFGTECRLTQTPAALKGEPLKEKYQFEAAYIALWTKELTLTETTTVTFYGLFRPNMPTAVTGAVELDRIRETAEAIDWSCNDAKPAIPMVRKNEFGGALASEPFDSSDLDRFFPDRLLEEHDKDNLLAFFKPDRTHVVLQAKELLVERPHGNIITTLPEKDTISKNLLTSTNHMYGLFNAQTTIGNTDSNRLLSANRGQLNLQKYSGQRLWIKVGESYRILTVPAAYEIAFNYSRWYYKLEDDIIVITAVAQAHESVISLKFRSLGNKTYDYVLTQQLSMGGAEFDQPIDLTVDGSTVTVKPVPGAASLNHYPQLAYRMTFPQGSTITDSRIFFEAVRHITPAFSGDQQFLGQNEISGNETLLCVTGSGASFEMTMTGTLDGTWPNVSHKGDAPDYAAAELQKYTDFYTHLLSGMHLELPESAGGTAKRDIQKLNILSYWYIHNALVHFLVPRGLEQVSGAAWGTRDVSQGPMELFLTFGHFDLARKTLLEVFAHQRQDTGEWPQWFMFDRYPYMADDCHGDVVFWPVKCLGDYIACSGDTSILAEQLPYCHVFTNDGAEHTMLAHAKRAVEAMQERFVGDTHLISYAGGDWDDTLQPADPRMKDHMISGWTQALAYQTVVSLRDALSGVEGGETASMTRTLSEMAEGIRADFNRYLIADDVIAGFGYVEEDGTLSYMLHPRDQKTGIHYRLLPLTRSIISRIVDQKQAKRNLDLIDTHLTFPDGIRLMDHPAGYEGGVSRYFQRAEQASCVGREISLQYVHAHIRYLEAMAALGDGERLYENLLKIVPINIMDHVPNARRRQSNAYFSSSEGDFRDRYEYARDFDRLRTGEIDVKGGWRIYSSGPGIFLGRLMGDMLGLRVSASGVAIDPVLPAALNGLSCTRLVNGKTIRFTFQVERSGGTVQTIRCGDKTVPFATLSNPYRPGGAWIDAELWSDMTQHCCEITVSIA